jgi:CheY-like chemotaxis protein
VEADEGRLVQVVLNLVTNALQALPEHDADRQWIRIRASAEHEGAVLIVSDSGPGISPAVAEQIFEEFFTTKPVGQGTGLGLPIAASIVRSFGGSISAGQDDSGGAAFRVWLPSVARAAAVDQGAPQRAPEGEAAAGALHILVVDDEPLIGSAVRAGLSPPHRVDVVTCAEEALPAALSGRYQVVLCDLMMPGTSGMDLYEQVEERAPELAGRFLFMSGGTFTERAAQFAERIADRLIEKPFDLDRLAQVIEGHGAKFPRSGDHPAQAPAATSDRKP